MALWQTTWIGGQELGIINCSLTNLISKKRAMWRLCSLNATGHSEVPVQLRITKPASADWCWGGIVKHNWNHMGISIDRGVPETVVYQLPVVPHEAVAEVARAVRLTDWLSICLVCLSVYLSVWLAVCLSVCLPSIYLTICLFVWQSIYLSVCLCICLSVCLSICLSV